ncbi:MAG: hypothetical protein RSA57_03900 [Cetobacterium sp.]
MDEGLLGKVYNNCIKTLKLIKDDNEYDDVRKDLQDVVKKLFEKVEVK